MNKLLTKIMATVTGFAMAIGVGLGIGTLNSNKEAKPAYAATIGTNLIQVTSITSGNQYVIVGNNNGYALPTEPSLSNGKVAGTAIADVPADGSGFLWTITATGNYFYINDGTNYIYHSNGGGSGTNLGYGSSTTYKWKLTYSTSGQDHWTFTGVNNTTENSRGMLVNGANFGGYALSNESSYKYMNIYEVAESTGPTTYTVTYDANGGEGTMTDPQSPYEEGSKVTVLGNEFVRDGFNFVNFNTARDGSGDDYDEDDTFTINANTTLYAQWEEQPSLYAWVYTAFDSLISSDKFTIVGTNANGSYSMSNDNGTTGAPSAVPATVSNGRLVGSIADEIKWSIGGNKSNGYTFYPNGDTETWLYSTDTNNGLRVGTNANKTFSLDDNGYLKHIGTSRYVGVYNGSDWRAYTSAGGNIANQTFGFYREVPNRILSSITLSGSYATAFTQGDAFSSAGLIVTANYENSTTEDVTERISITGYDTINGSGEQTVTVTYIEGNVTATDTYTITVSPATMYSVTGNIVNGSISNDEDIRENNALNININADERYERPATLTVTMGGNTLSLNSDYTYNSDTGAFSIVHVIGDVSIEGACERSNGLWIDLPYSIAEATAAIDAGKNITNAYVKGIVSQIDSLSNTSLTYWISDDGTTNNQFEVYRGKGLGGANFTATTDIQVGASVIIKGNMQLYNTTYEFASGSQQMLYSSAVLHATETAGVVDSVSIIFNTKVLKTAWASYGDISEFGMMLFKTQKNEIPTVEERYNSDPNKDTNPTKVLVVNGDYGLEFDGVEGTPNYYSFTVAVENISASKYAYKYCASPYNVVGAEHNFLGNMVCSVNSLADAGLVDQELSATALNSLKSVN